MSTRKPQPHGHMAEGGFMCCGLDEYEGLNSQGFTAAGAIRVMVEVGNYISRDRYGNGGGYEDVCGCSHIIMTQKYSQHTNATVGCRNINNFKRYVDRHKLGTVSFAAVKTNPNSGNKIKAAIFAPSVAAMAAWGRERGLEDQHEEQKRERERWGGGGYYAARW